MVVVIHQKAISGLCDPSTGCGFVFGTNMGAARVGDLNVGEIGAKLISFGITSSQRYFLILKHSNANKSQLVYKWEFFHFLQFSVLGGQFLKIVRS